MASVETSEEPGRDPDTPRLAIMAGHGDLPGEILAANPDALVVTIDGTGVVAPQGADHLAASFEKLGALFRGLKVAHVSRVVLAGGIRRPNLNPARFDAKMLSVVPRVLPALGKGDDALLSLVIDIFEREGFALVAVEEAAPNLLAAEGVIAGKPPDRAMREDAERGREILSALSAVDVGQGVVVAGGQCVGLETAQGTDAMIRFVGASDPSLFRGQRPVLVKRPKLGQDRRADLPTIGPNTIKAAAAAGIGGIEIAAGGCLILHRERVKAAAEAASISLWAVL
ncbi:MAG: UDP-2,3-diacylglucosamine diphosphatase LpxI [Pseudomonadota bacterium]